MTRVKFIRSTHENGRFCPFPTGTYPFWHAHGWLVGEVLRLEQALTFAELITASEGYLFGTPGIRHIVALE